MTEGSLRIVSAKDSDRLLASAYSFLCAAVVSRKMRALGLRGLGIAEAEMNQQHVRHMQQCHTAVSGRLRYRFPVSLAKALATAGEITGTGGSPHPVGASVLGTMWTSAATGASTM